jgi:paraquat-inducible protein B
VKTLARNLDGKLEPLTASIEETLTEARAGIGDARELFANIDKKTTPLISKIQKATESAQIALEQASQTLNRVEQIVEEGSQLRYEVSETLRDISAASRSVRVLADFIDQHPDALLRGRVTPTGEK